LVTNGKIVDGFTPVEWDELLIKRWFAFIKEPMQQSRALPIFGDALFPTRRVDRSPMLCEMPPFGTKTPASQMRTPGLSPQISAVPATPYRQFEAFAVYTKSDV
jgi:hypothetical protein